MMLARNEAAEAGASPALRRLAAAASVETTPRQACEADLARLPPEGMRVHVPHLPGAAFEERRAAVAAIAAAGLRPVPHVAARETTDAAALDRELAALLAAGAEAVMLIGGGGEPRGPFPDAASLLESGALRRAGVRRLALAAHPEGHPQAEEAALTAALTRKLAAAEAFAEEVWLVTQFVFEPAPALGWLERLRAAGVAAPVRIGLSGPATARAALSYALRCGVGPSLKALQSRPSLATRMTRRWSPEPVAEAIAAKAAARPELGIEALHLFPFGGLEPAADWLAQASGRA